MMIQVGDMVKLVKGGCPCHFCEEVKGDYCEVVDITRGHIRIKLRSGGVDFPKDWTFDVQSGVQENE